MFCFKCGNQIDDASTVCPFCGAQQNQNLNKNQYQNAGQNQNEAYDTPQYNYQPPAVPLKEDKPSFGFALLGFLIPLVGLILYVAYHDNEPKKAKSAGKGALISVIIRVFLIIVFLVLYLFGISSLFDSIHDIASSSASSYSDSVESALTEKFDDFFESNSDNTEEILENYVDVEIGDFTIKEEQYYTETCLDVTLRNKADVKKSFYVTIEAVDENGARLDTDMVYVSTLNPNQETHLKAFEFVENDKLDSFKNAQFKVLEVEMYDY